MVDAGHAEVRLAREWLPHVARHRPFPVHLDEVSLPKTPSALILQDLRLLPQAPFGCRICPSNNR